MLTEQLPNGVFGIAMMVAKKDAFMCLFLPKLENHKNDPNSTCEIKHPYTVFPTMPGPLDTAFTQTVFLWDSTAK